MNPRGFKSRLPRSINMALPNNKIISSRGFTLIELLVVIAIIGILSSIVLASLNTARSQARDVNRKSDLKQLQIALELYFENNNGYPSTNSVWYSSESGDISPDNGGNYIPGLAPTYISVLPRDPRGGASQIVPPCSGWKASYHYRSDGTNYKLLSHCAPENPWTSSSPFYDPQRSSWAWMVCSGPPACNTW